MAPDHLPAAVVRLLADGTTDAVHVTSAAAAESIGACGLHAADGSRSGTVLWGAGVYVALDGPSADLWRGPGTVDVPVAVTCVRPYVHDYDAHGTSGTSRGDWESIAVALVRELDDSGFAGRLAARADAAGLRSVVRSVEHAQESPAVLRVALLAAALTRVCRSEATGRAPGRGRLSQREVVAARAAGQAAMLQEAGYDAIVVVERVPSVHAGGNQVCVFDPTAAALAR